MTDGFVERARGSAWFRVLADTLPRTAKVGQESFDVGCPGLPGVAAAAEADEPAGPEGVGLLGTKAVVETADAVAQDGEQSGAGGGGDGILHCGHAGA